MELRPERVVDRALELLRTVPYVHVATAGSTDVNVRQVQLLAVDDDGTAWFMTSPRSRKAAEMRVSGRATLATDDAGTFTAIAAAGTTELIDEPAQLEARWIEELARFFPDGPTGGDCVLVRIVLDRIEVIDFAGGITPPPFGLVPAVAVRDGDGWRVVPAERND
ncbi:MAG: pyridoxamine 5'-phosphate oxidase family protein [Actinomycetota bacterium]